MRTRDIAADLDGFLAEYDGFVSVAHIGRPVERAVRMVQLALKKKHRVWIFTARVAPPDHLASMCDVDEAYGEISKWCREHIGVELPITSTKRREFYEFWDDRAVRICQNTGVDASDSKGSLWWELSQEQEQEELPL